MALQAVSTISALGFGALCLASAIPLMGIPFPTTQSAAYYRRKNMWLSQLSGGVLSAAIAGYLAAALRIVVGIGIIIPDTREATMAVNGAVVAGGTILAIRDGRPLAPQFGMLVPMGIVYAIGRLARS